MTIDLPPLHDTGADHETLDAASPRVWSLGLAAPLAALFVLYALAAVFAPALLGAQVGGTGLTVAVYLGTGLIVASVLAVYLYAYGVDDADLEPDATDLGDERDAP